MRIAVTGAAGYIGSVLCQQLINAGHSVTGIDYLIYNNKDSINHLLSYPKSVFKFVKFDLKNLPLRFVWELKQADVIIPLAAIVGAPACDKDTSLAKMINYHSVLDIIELYEGKRIIYPNTNSGYGIGGEAYCTEESPLNPISEYGKTKCQSEKEVLKAGGVSLRLATVCGVSPRMRFDLLVNDLSSQLFYNDEVTLYEPNFKRNYVHIQDVCRAFLWMISHPELKGVYNVGHPQANCSKLELAERICRILCIAPEKAIKFGQGSDPDKRDYIVSNDKILSTGFTFKHTVEDAIEQVCHFCALHRKEELINMRNA